jgi:hypothetical protein
MSTMGRSASSSHRRPLPTHSWCCHERRLLQVAAGRVKHKKGFDLPAARRAEICRLARAIDVADTDDFRTILIAWQWHNPDSKDPVGALMIAARQMGGTITETEAESVIQEADTVPKCRGADNLGKYLRITDEMRTALQIRTIGSFDVSKRQRAARRRARDHELKRTKRRQRGAKPRAEYLATHAISRDQPWRTEGISRRTWYNRLAEKRAPPLLHKSVGNPLLVPRCTSPSAIPLRHTRRTCAN